MVQDPPPGQGNSNVTTAGNTSVFHFSPSCLNLGEENTGWGWRGWPATHGVPCCSVEPLAWPVLGKMGDGSLGQALNPSVSRGCLHRSLCQCGEGGFDQAQLLLLEKMTAFLPAASQLHGPAEWQAQDQRAERPATGPKEEVGNQWPPREGA